MEHVPEIGGCNNGKQQYIRITYIQYCATYVVNYIFIILKYNNMYLISGSEFTVGT